MSAVHRQIALAALDSLPAEEKALFNPWREAFAFASTYPDVFADTAMSREAKERIDPEADLLTYPPPPDEKLAERIEKISAARSAIGAVPLRQAYLIGHYLRKALEALARGDGRFAAKLCAVYSHVIGDIAEPIHALHPSIVDAALPPPPEFQGLELHACVEGLMAPVSLKGRKPELLGSTPERVEMAAYAALERCRELGASLAAPIAKALYERRKAEAKKLSSLAQSAAAAAFSDFLHTVAALYLGKASVGASEKLELRHCPCACAEMDMLYRYRPSADLSLIPYSGGKTKPLTVLDAKGRRKRVTGLGMIASLAPPFGPGRVRKGSAEYYLVPGAFKELTTLAGLNPLFPEALTGCVFRVYADGGLVAESPVLEPGSKAVELRAPLGEARWLKLEVEYTRNPAPEEIAKLHCAWASHAVWGFVSLS